MFKKGLLKKVAEREGVSTTFLNKQLKAGKLVIPWNKNKEIKKPVAIGEGVRVKVNTNIGTSTEEIEIKDEIEKLKVAVKFGTDTVMDLSVGGDLKKIRKRIINSSPVAIGTVPIYQAASEVERRKGGFEKIDFADIWDVLKEEAEEGVDFFTIHAGVLRGFLEIIRKEKRVGGIVSRGGAILTRWMYVNRKENPLYENFDKILQLASKYNITLSLGDALRPGAIADSTDRLQIAELYVLAELVKKCRRWGVQVMVEGPGHIRLDEIAFNMALEKKLCNNAPFYVLGPLPTDIAAGYDHISSAIGGAIAALYGADFLCVVTPSEHLSHPSIEDIKEGVIASKIAAHCVDVLRFNDEWKKDYALSSFRARREWKRIFPLTIDKNKAIKYRKRLDARSDICTMCGSFCSLKITEKCNL
jgi:phosphomethylpyrimidine synthase